MSQAPLLDAGVSPLLSVRPQLVVRWIYSKLTEVQDQARGQGSKSSGRDV